MMLPAGLAKVLKGEKYQLVGKYAAVKKCHWMAQALVHGRFCYKSKFYGIQSHRCIQLSPSVVHCTQRCKFCWRVQPEDLGVWWMEAEMRDWDDPEHIVEEATRAQRRILTGYKAHKLVDKCRFEEAWNPKHVAISLAGEPTLYPRLAELIHEFHKRKMTTFVVTNGTIPKALELLGEEPTQLYISVCAPNESVFKELCRPQIPDAWSKLKQSLELLSSFACPTVIRITLVKGFNMVDLEGYAKLVGDARPTYVEPKAFMHVGFARRRLAFESMPSHSEVKDFACRLSELTGYNILDESAESRVVLLSRLEKPIRFD